MNIVRMLLDQIESADGANRLDLAKQAAERLAHLQDRIRAELEARKAVDRMETGA